MNPPYPPPGQPYPPGYPPPSRRGMGCFAKGCLVTLALLLVLGLLAGAGGWYVYSNVRPFVSTEAVPVPTFPATAAQYAELLNRVQLFENNVDNGVAATLELSADDMNVCVARSPAYESARGKMYFSIVDNQLVIDTSVPLGGSSRSSSGGTVVYFSGKLYCDVAYAAQEFDIKVSKIETLAGRPASAFIAAVVASPDFNRGLSRSFNEGFQSSLHKNPAGEAFMAKVRSIGVASNHVVIAAGP